MDPAVRVAVREAPLRRHFQNNNNKNQTATIALNPQRTVHYPPDCNNALVVDGTVYSFDHVFERGVSQAKLYEELIHPLILKVLSGHNCTALAYGQTGTGKSYSMGLSLDAEYLDDEHIGVVPRCLADIFDGLAASQENAESTDVSASFIEIYNENVYDLLASAEAPVLIRVQKFSGSTRKPIRNQNEFRELLIQGTASRHVRSTNMNANSSRSHAIFTIHVRNARLNIVDLAGSEGLRRTGHEGVARTEGVHINQGLLCINRVLLAMSAGNRVIPYRDSVLTTALQESLNCQSYFTLLACISSEPCDLSETNSTLRFAKNAKQLKLTPQQNQLQMDLLRKNNMTASKTTSTPIFKRPLSCSKRPLGIRTPFNTNLYTPGKIVRQRSDMGLTPRAKERARKLLHLDNVEAAASAATNAEQPSFLEPSAIFDPFADVNVACSTPMNGWTVGGLERTGAECSSIAVPSREEFDNLKHQYLDLTVILDKIYQVLTPQQRQHCALPATKAATKAATPNQMMSFIGRRELSRETPAEQPERVETSLLQTSGDSVIAEQTTVQFRVSRSPSEMAAESAKQDSFQSPSSNIGASASVSESAAALNLQRTRLPLRRSTRLLSRTEFNPTENLKDRRRSERISRKSIKKETSPANTQKVASRQRLNKHSADMLELLNSGTAKQLQLLPTIGAKTALALVTQRNLMGSFEDWAQVEKLPAWRGSGFKRFKEANCLVL
ncbi:kinesin-like protein Nod [Scaptodrosophila lebanonensis]|uniref:Kinesin-like protein n=1 Tax=Drosophila lebanonensis TaxID=7225 RepID=A0A6J2U0V9_DROLE|nr:kinesin-like protein Nod [Scaptodrosophila lebanonensis]